MEAFLVDGLYQTESREASSRAGILQLAQSKAEQTRLAEVSRTRAEATQRRQCETEGDPSAPPITADCRP